MILVEYALLLVSTVSYSIMAKYMYTNGPNVSSGSRLTC